MTMRKKQSLFDTWKLSDGRSIGDVRVHELPALAEAAARSGGSRHLNREIKERPCAAPPHRPF